MYVYEETYAFVTIHMENMDIFLIVALNAAEIQIKYVATIT
jgi:hypothetical protein